MLPSPTGPHRVGCVELDIPAPTAAGRVPVVVYYPAHRDAPSSGLPPPEWLPTEHAAALGRAQLAAAAPRVREPVVRRRREQRALLPRGRVAAAAAAAADAAALALARFVLLALALLRLALLPPSRLDAIGGGRVASLARPAAGAAALSAALLLQLAALAQSLFVGVGLHVDGVPLSVYKTKCVREGPELWVTRQRGAMA